MHVCREHGGLCSADALEEMRTWSYMVRIARGVGFGPVGWLGSVGAGSEAVGGRRYGLLCDEGMCSCCVGPN